MFIASVVAVLLLLCHPDEATGQSCDPSKPNYVPTGLVIDFAGLPENVDVALLFRFEFQGRERYDWKVTTGDGSDATALRGRLGGVLKRSGWEVRSIGDTKLEVRTAPAKVAGREDHHKVSNITIESKTLPKEQLPKVTKPNNEA